MSVPGIGRILAMTLLFEIDTIERFPTVKDFTRYFMLHKGTGFDAERLIATAI